MIHPISKLTRRCALRRPLLASLVFLASVVVSADASDWPQWLGPRHDGSSPDAQLAKAWPKEGPPVLWKRSVGQGFAGPAVSSERLILFHRLEDQAVVECLNARTGSPMWTNKYPTNFRDTFGFDDGPRATPAIAEGRVFTYGAEGRLSCWKLETGEALWSVDAAREFKSAQGFFGRASSPLADGNRVIIMPGGRDGAGVVALEAASGKVLWQVSGDEASYASPTLATIHGSPVLLTLSREALLALRPTDGQLIFRHPWRPRESSSVSAATPVVVEDLIFLSACYGAVPSLLRFKETGPETVWSDADALANHYATSLHHAGFLYGWHGRQEQGCELRCVELKTGKVRWSEPGLKAGSVILAGDELLVLTERGLLLRALATPDGFKPTARAQVLPGEVRAWPALADGRLFARSRSQFVCLDLRQGP